MNFFTKNMENCPKIFDTLDLADRPHNESKAQYTLDIQDKNRSL